MNELRFRSQEWETLTDEEKEAEYMFVVTGVYDSLVIEYPRAFFTWRVVLAYTVLAYVAMMFSQPWTL